MPCLSDLVVERRNTSNAPYSQNEQQKESSFLKEFYEYQKKQQEELAAYSQTSVADINKATITGRYLVQPAINTNSFDNSDNGLLAANPSNSKDISYEDLKTRDIQLDSKEYNFKTATVTLDKPEYNLKTANITLTDTSDIYKALATRAIPESEYTFAKQYGELSTFSLSTLFGQGVGMYADWHTSPIAYSTADGAIEQPLAEKSSVALYDVVSSNLYNSKYDYYSLAYNNRSIMAPSGLIGNIYNSSAYSYESLLNEAIELSDNTGIIYPNVPTNGWPTYKPMQLVDEMWNLYNNSRLTTEANNSSVGIYNPVGAWEADEQAFFHRIPLLGDLQQRLSDLEGSSILWQAFYNKKSTDPLQIYKLANVNTNVIYMTGRFIPQPPITNDIRFVSDMVPSALGGKVAGAVGNLVGGIPTYPYIPLPYAMPQYKIFTVGQQPYSAAFSLYNSYIWNLSLEQNDLLKGYGEFALKYSRSLTPFESIAEHSDKITITHWDATAISYEMEHYRSVGWEPLGDLENNDYFDEDAQSSHVPSYLPSEFGYDKLQDFEGHTTIYDLEIQKPSDAADEMPDFICDDEGSLAGYSLANYTSITAIPDAEIKAGQAYSLGEFGSFLLSANYMDYITNIQTKTLETAECDCYKWAKKYIEWFYGKETPNKYRHRSLYKSYYKIIIRKIYYQKNNAYPISRIIQEKEYYGVPLFNLTEVVQDNRIQELPITWNIIGHGNTVTYTTQNINSNDSGLT